MYLQRAPAGRRRRRNSVFRDMKESMDRLDELAAFVAILDTGNLAAAGRRPSAP